MTDVYAAGEAPIEGISGATIRDEVTRQTGRDVTYIPEKEKLAGWLKDHVQPGDLVITMGAGDIYKTGEELAAMLQK